jgi:hypothetical protein
VRQLGGEIVCESQWGHGSRFIFQVKLERLELEAENEINFQRCINPRRQRMFPRINIAEERQQRPDMGSSSENEDASDSDQSQ